MELAIAGLKASLQDKTYTVLQISDTHPVLGPVYGNYHELLKKIKKALDPANLANPPNPIQVDETEDCEKSLNSRREEDNGI